MKSVIHSIQSEDFPRIRIGTGFCEDKSNLIEYVISKVSKEEYLELQKGINAATEAVNEIIKNGIDNAMNQFN